MYDPRNSRFRGLLRLLLAVVFSLSLNAAHASFPATSTVPPGACTTAPCYAYYGIDFVTSVQNLGPFTTGEAACTAAAASYSANRGGGYTATASGGYGDCVHTYSQYGSYVGTSGSSIYAASVPPASPTYSCPANATLSGSSCTCNGGTVQQGNACLNPCAAKSGQPAGWYSAPYIPSEGVSGPKYTNLCPTEGGQSCGITVTYTVGFDGVKSGDAKYTGSACVADPNSDGSGTTAPSPSTSNPPEPGQPAPSPCKPGQYSGTVNGVQRCIDPSGHTPVETTKTTVENNGTDTVKKESTTVCNAGACNTTTTTTTTNNSTSSVTVTTGTKSEPKGDYCTANPNSSQCSTECQGNTGTVACAKFGNPVDGELPTNEVNIPTVQTDNLAGFNIGHSCPADLTYTISGKQYALSFKAACDVAPMVKPVVLLGAALGALLIVYAALVGKTS